MSKKFYWLKIQEHFFDSDEMIYFDSIENGEKYIVIWMKILLKCLKDKDNGEYGFLRFNDKLPYNDELLAKVLRCDLDSLRVAMKYFQDLNMVQILDDKTIYIESVQKMIGKESDSAQRVLKHRAKKKALESNIPYIDKYQDNKLYNGNYYIVLKRDNYRCVSCNSDENICVHHIVGYDDENNLFSEKHFLVTLCRKCHSTEHNNPGKIINTNILSKIDFDMNYQYMINDINSNSSVTKCNVTSNPNKEIELYKDIELDKEKKPRNKKFTPPTIQEIQEYIIEKQYRVDAETFFYHYQSKDWHVGKNKMKCWKSALGGWNAREKNGKAPANEPKITPMEKL